MGNQIQFPDKLKFLFSPYRYKVAYGGRGSSKSWSFARALLVQGAAGRLRIGCFREVQKSIKDSVHRLLSDQIAELGLGSFYEILETEIRGKNGTVFLFSGLSSQTAESLKSYEGLDRAWVEEAQSVSKRSWNVLTPTIRKDGSEIWVSFNPELDTDETYSRFVTSPPPHSFVAEVNYHDNPWFPSVLEQERIHCEITNKEDYAQIWEGKCRLAVSGAIYAREVAESIRGGRICNVPYDPTLRVHCVYDLGWNDSMVIILVQKLRSEIRIIGYIEDDHKTLDWYVAELQKLRYNWGYDFIPHDGAAKDFKTGKSTEELLKAFGRKVKMIQNIGIENGIKACRLTFSQMYFDKSSTVRLVECAKRYRRAINQSTSEAGAPVHDEFSHGADGLRYTAIVADQMTNESDEHRPVRGRSIREALDSVVGY